MFSFEGIIAKDVTFLVCPFKVAINLSMRLQKLAEMLKIPKDNLIITY